MLRGRGVALIIVGLIVAGCDGSSPSPKPTATIPAAKPVPEAGQCLAKEVPDLDDFAPDLDTRVDCTEPHVYEMSAVLDMPKRLVKGTTPEELVAERDKLATLDNDDEARRKFREYAGRQCGPSHTKAAGLSKLELNGKSIEEATVGVVLRDAQTWLNLLDAGNWAEGNTKFLCLIRYSKGISAAEDLPDPKPIRSRSRNPVVQSFLTKDFPLRHRQCARLEANGRAEPLPCDTPHQGEMLFGFDARPVLGTKFVQSIGLDQPSKEEAKTLNRPCIDALPSFLGAGYDDDLTAVALIGGGGWAARGGFYPTTCIVVARDSALHLPGGTLIGGGARSVDLVPAGQSQVAWLRSR
ncbi:hypothetical protein [Aeromicrobium sp.]|uniref:hypothetical protein n=1 Tax=Aeromicrobium sp. TaxID=1871063 RepID=UPI002FC9241E